MFLQSASHQSLGKYNKKAFLPVHRQDNLAIALAWLRSHGVSHGCTAQGKYFISISLSFFSLLH